MVSRIAILGATGSIGRQALQVIAQNPEQYSVFAVTANSNVKALFDVCKTFRPRYAVLTDIHKAKQLSDRLAEQKLSTVVLSGISALQEVVANSECDTVLAGIAGSAGLLSTLAAARAGKRILLANKEALVMAGQLFMQVAQANGATIVPVDSEHNAIFQCLPNNFVIDGAAPKGVKKIVLTASGGPFLNTPLPNLPNVNPAQALRHPNWSMGAKVTIDSATMMNKGLEMIEAHWLFGAGAVEIDAIIHPQSIVHSFVHYEDGSLLAQLGNPDMRIPIACALAWPDRCASGAVSLDILDMAEWKFLPMDAQRFPCFSLAKQALQNGHESVIYLNAANEVAVEAFLSSSIKFTQIAQVVEEVMSLSQGRPITDVDSILYSDNKARCAALKLLNKGTSFIPAAAVTESI